MTNSIDLIRGNDGANLASSPRITTIRSPGSTTILVDTVAGLPASFIAEMGTPDLVTGLITNGVVFRGHTGTGEVIIDDIGAGYADAGSAVNDVIVLKPTAEWANNIADAIESLYPIGTIYTNKTNATNPATLLGFGTWTAITDKFIVAAGSTYTAGTAYGAATHTHDAGSIYAQVELTGSTLKGRRVDGAYSSQVQASLAFSAGGGTTTYGTPTAGTSASGPSIPPTIAAYVWERTA